MTFEPSLRPSDRVAIVGAVSPATVAAPGTVSTGWVDAKDFARFLAIVQTGTLPASAVVAAKMEQATDAAGAGVKNLPGRAITDLDATADDKQALVNASVKDLDHAGGFGFVRLTLTVTGANAPVSAVLLGFNPRYFPASDYDAASVVEIV